MGSYILYDLFQSTGEICAKFGSDQFRNVDLYKVQTNIHLSLYIYIRWTLLILFVLFQDY
jgi:hypothetical protein